MSNSQMTAYGFGVATENQSGQTLDCYFYSLGLGSKPENNQVNNFKSQLGEDSIRKVKKVPVEHLLILRKELLRA